MPHPLKFSCLHGTKIPGTRVGITAPSDFRRVILMQYQVPGYYNTRYLSTRVVGSYWDSKFDLLNKNMIKEPRSTAVHTAVLEVPNFMADVLS